MLDHRQGFTGKAKALDSSSPTYQIRSSGDNTGDIEFDFWGAHDTMYDENFSDKFGTDIEFEVQASLVEEEIGGYSLPIWKRSTSKNVQIESSPLLPHNHHSSNLSPTSRRKAIADGRRQLMEMIKDMPESSYELSLKDIVDEQNSLEEAQEGPDIKESSFHFETEAQIKKKKKKGINKARQLSRIESMESENFLLKMFFPTSLSFKKKTKAGNNSKVSPRPSFEGTEDHIDKEWWLKRFFLSGENKRSRGSSRTGSTNSSTSSTSRHDDTNFTPGCWSFFHTNKDKTKRHRGLLVY